MVVFVTAASSNHFKSACQFLGTIKNQNVIFYDIGLTQTEADDLKNRFQIDYRMFPFEKYPDFVSLSAQDAGAYAWKPIIISDVYPEIHDILIWCDSGNKVTDASALIRCIQTHSVYTPTSSGTLSRWTHPTALAGLGVPKSWYGFAMRNAACVGFTKGVYAESFISEWKALALNKEISLPLGANRSNHRWDQSILTFLYYKYRVPRYDDYVGFSIHNDID